MNKYEVHCGDLFAIIEADTPKEAVQIALQEMDELSSPTLSKFVFVIDLDTYDEYEVPTGDIIAELYIRANL